MEFFKNTTTTDNNGSATFYDDQEEIDEETEKLTDHYYQYCDLTFRMIDLVFFYYCIAVVVIGVIGNSGGVVFLLWGRCRFANSLNIYLIAVYVCDLGFLLCLSLQLAKTNRASFYTTSISCEIAVYVVNVLSFVSQWSMGAISFERYLAVCRPMSIRYQQMSTVQVAVNIMLSVAVIAMALEVWVFFIVETTPQGDCDFRASASYLFDTFNLVDSFLSYAVPGIMIAYFTACIFRALRKRESTFREIDPSALRTNTTGGGGAAAGGSANGLRIAGSAAAPGLRTESYETVVVISRGASERTHRRERQAAWFLMAVVLTDTLLNVQNYALRLFNTFHKAGLKYCVAYRVVQVISYMLYYSQFALNVLYFIFCPSRKAATSGSRKTSRHESASSAGENARKRSMDSYSNYYRTRIFNANGGVGGGSSPCLSHNARTPLVENGHYQQKGDNKLVPPSRTPSSYTTGHEEDDL